MRTIRQVLRLGLGRQVCLLVAACLIAAPLTAQAAEAAAETAAVGHCDAVTLEADGGAHSDADHDHHAHGCGSCHMHFLTARAPAPGVTRCAASGRAPVSLDAPVQAPSSALYRPPRL